jgi:hypothetical protein
VGNPQGDPVPVWNYVSRSPTNNPKAFDIWTVIYFRGAPVVVSNWRNGQ